MIYFSHLVGLAEVLMDQRAPPMRRQATRAMHQRANQVRQRAIQNLIATAKALF